MDRDDILGQLPARGRTVERVVGRDAASVVVATGPGAVETVPAPCRPGQGALGGSTACGSVRGRDVVVVAIDPQVLTAEVDDEVYGDLRCPLVDHGDILLGGGVFANGED